MEVALDEFTLAIGKRALEKGDWGSSGIDAYSTGKYVMLLDWLWEPVWNVLV